MLVKICQVCLCVSGCLCSCEVNGYNSEDLSSSEEKSSSLFAVLLMNGQSGLDGGGVYYDKLLYCGWCRHFSGWMEV